MKYLASLIAAIFGALALAATYKDVVTGDRSWHVIGEVWFAWSPTSLQVGEAIVSRYIDPCGAFAGLGCAPFLWHPVIATVLTWYAAPVFIILTLAFALLGRYLGRRGR